MKVDGATSILFLDIRNLFDITIDCTLAVGDALF